MKRKLGMIILVFALMTLAACGKAEEATPAEDTGELQPLEVELTVSETADVNESVKMVALVTQGAEKIEDADEVEFEIWEEGKKEDSIKIESTNEKEGIYTAEKAFDTDGVYNVQVHVTARNLHTMPKTVVTVGQGAEHTDGTESEHEGTEHAHGGTEGFSMHFMDLKDATANEEAKLVTHLQMEGKPLEKVKVRYEIWNEASPDKHDWVDSSENVAGEYAATHSFATAGNYIVQVHVEDENGLHEHEEHAIVVK